MSKWFSRKKVNQNADNGSSLPENELTDIEQAHLSQQFNQAYEAASDAQHTFDVTKSYAEQGCVDAMYLLALMYEKGDQHQSYPDLAADFYWRAAKQGKPEAQYNLALMCAQGSLGEPDMLNAWHWFSAAAESGVVQAMYNLATCYDQGLGCVEDKALAFTWFEKAGKAGFAKAWHNMGVMFYSGEGTQRNPIEAYAFTLLAARHQVEEAQAFEKHLTQELKAEQIQVGKARLDELIKSFES